MCTSLKHHPRTKNLMPPMTYSQLGNLKFVPDQNLGKMVLNAFEVMTSLNLVGA